MHMKLTDNVEIRSGGSGDTLGFYVGGELHRPLTGIEEAMAKRIQTLEARLSERGPCDTEEVDKAVYAFAEEVWDEMLKKYKTLRIFPRTMAKEWANRRKENTDADH